MRKLLPLFLVILFIHPLFSQIKHPQASVFNTERPKSMSQRWELDTLSSPGTFILTPYKPIYLLPMRWSSSPAGQPRSGNSGEQYDNPNNLDLNNLEAKFQLSFKMKIFQGLFWGHGDLWGGLYPKEPLAGVQRQPVAPVQGNKLRT
ncbi:phospholipase A [Flavobacterium sp. RHBU_3]|uniref:phospholipase A n=1 Tax=Flavobacterium sp. RHBU_3 TaxID=3391184 RepID=UPI0039848894